MIYNTTKFVRVWAHPADLENGAIKSDAMVNSAKKRGTVIFGGNMPQEGQ